MKHGFKAGLLALSIFSAFGAQAAEVSIYGGVSTGAVFSQSEALSYDGVKQSDRTRNFSMESAWYGDSIFGITGEEELGNGWKVGFTLENEFASDSGELADSEKLFDSQSYLWVGNDLMKVAAGNIGGLASAGGDFDLVGGFDPLEAAFGVGGMGLFASRDYASANSLVLEVTPADGLKLSAMGTFGEDDSEAKWSQRTHYYAVGAAYETGPFAAAAVLEMLDYAGSSDVQKNAYFYTVGASVDFEFVKPVFMYQHGEHVATWQGEALDPADRYQTDSFLLGATASAANGTVMASMQYLEAKHEASGTKGSATVLGLAYTYELSKRTVLYTGATWAAGDKGLDKDLSVSDGEFGALEGIRGDLNGWTAGLGIAHSF